MPASNRRLKIPLLLGDDRIGEFSLTFLRDHDTPPRFFYFPFKITKESRRLYTGVFIMDRNTTGPDRFFSGFQRLLTGRRKRVALSLHEGAPLEIIQAEQGHFWFNINDVERISKMFHFPDKPRRMVCPPFTPDGWALSAAISLDSARALCEFMHAAWKRFCAKARA